MIWDHLEKKLDELGSSNSFDDLNRNYYESIGYYRCMFHIRMISYEAYNIIQHKLDHVREERQYELLCSKAVDLVPHTQD